MDNLLLPNSDLINPKMVYDRQTEKGWPTSTILDHLVKHNYTVSWTASWDEGTDIFSWKGTTLNPFIIRKKVYTPNILFIPSS